MIKQITAMVINNSQFHYHNSSTLNIMTITLTVLKLFNDTASIRGIILIGFHYRSYEMFPWKVFNGKFDSFHLIKCEED